MSDVRTSKTSSWFPIDSGIGGGQGGGYRMPAGLPSDAPLFRLIMPWFGPDDTLHPEGSVIAWDGGLNEHMEPLNEAAVAKMRDYLTHLDHCAQLKAQIEGRQFVARAGDFADFAAKEWENRPKYDPAMPRSSPDAAVRPDMLSPAKKRDMYAKRASKLLGVQEPSTGREPASAKVVNVLGSTYTGDAQKDAR